MFTITFTLIGVFSLWLTSLYLQLGIVTSCTELIGGGGWGGICGGARGVGVGVVWLGPFR